VKKKGRLKKGMDADVVIFNPDTISDVGTYTASNQLALNVQSMLINNALAAADGKLIFDAAPGQPIRRPMKKQ
jgi:N-acyl-D-glutamate deacylase